MSALSTVRDCFDRLAILYRDTDTSTRQLALQLFAVAGDLDTDVGITTADSLLTSCELVEEARTSFDIRFGFYAGIPAEIRAAREALEKYEASR